MPTVTPRRSSRSGTCGGRIAHRRAFFAVARVEIEAVRGVSFEIEQGELFGLLGPNGAGKTTTIKMLITLLIPTSGSARVLGLDVVEGSARGPQADRLRVRRRARAVRAAVRRSTTCAISPSCRRCRRPSRSGGSTALLELVGLKGRERRARRGLFARDAPAAAHRAWVAARPRGASSSTSRRSASTRSAPASCGR